MDTENKTWTTEPGCYTEAHLLKDVPAEVLSEVRAKAHTAHLRAGGHNHAARMERVVNLVDAELASR